MVIDEFGSNWINECIPGSASYQVIPLGSSIPYILRPKFFFKVLLGIFQGRSRFYSLYESLIEIMKSTNPEERFHYLDWADTYVINTEIFKSKSWTLWINAVNKSGGIYKYRWGDNEIYSLYAHIYLGTIYDLKTVDDGYHDQGMFRGLCDLAPNVKDVRK